MSVLASSISLGLSIAAFKSSIAAAKAQSSSASGQVDANAGKVAEAQAAKAQQLAGTARVISEIGSSINSIITNSAGLSAAEMKCRAEIALANAELVRAYLQEILAEMNTGDSAYREASQQLSQILELIKQLLNLIKSANDAITHNV